MGKMFKEMFEEVGFRCKLTNVGTDESGDMLTGILGEDRPWKAHHLRRPHGYRS